MCLPHYYSIGMLFKCVICVRSSVLCRFSIDFCISLNDLRSWCRSPSLDQTFSFFLSVSKLSGRLHAADVAQIAQMSRVAKRRKSRRMLPSLEQLVAFNVIYAMPGSRVTCRPA